MTGAGANGTGDGDERESLRARINAETARIDWRDLERHFAQGIVLRVSDGSDLVEMAVAMALDEREVISEALERGTIARAVEQDAVAWQGRSLWAVVVAPWVLVQLDDGARRGRR